MQRLRQLSSPLLPLLLLALSACPSNPVRTAQTVEQKGDAYYGVYTIAKEQCAKLLQDPAVPDAAKRPIAEAMVASDKPANHLQDVVATLGNGSTEEQVSAAIVAAQPLINDLVAALVKAKPGAQALANQLEALK